MKGDNATAFNCTGICPTDVPHKIFPQDSNDEPYCSIEPVGQAFLLLVQFSTSLHVNRRLCMHDGEFCRTELHQTDKHY
jgi:hypothetical protein